MYTGLSWTPKSAILSRLSLAESAKLNFFKTPASGTCEYLAAGRAHSHRNFTPKKGLEKGLRKC
jgi:hypothetical protein